MATTDTYADIIVVGAGMAGLYFSWRMLNLNQPSSLKIINLEKLNRTGGRLDTDVVYINGEPVKNEEGGMRFDQGMTQLMWLLNQLGKSNDIVPFGMGDDNNIYNLRGQKFTFGAMAQNPTIWSTIYNLNLNEQGKQPNMILQEVFESILTNNGINPTTNYPQTPSDWQKVRLSCLYRGIPLYQWGFWALLKDYGLSQECMQMIEDSMGFLAFYNQEVNAGVGFQTMGDFDKLPQYLTLKPGYETLADTLTNQINSLGGQILLQNHVDTFTINTDNTINVVATTPNGPASFVCKYLILALPSLPLQALAYRTPVLRDNAQFMSDVQTVTSMPLTKINLYFTERWWYNNHQISTGGSFTDLPMAQFYCYTPISDDNAGPASMTIYCDYDRTGYWDTLQRIGTPFPPTNGLTQPANTTAASTFVVEQAMRQLGTFFQDNTLPQPVLSTYVGWGTSDAGDGDHSWKVGVNDLEVMLRIASPAPNVYVCGEAYSDEQAWVDGALRSTENLLEAVFSPHLVSRA
jgi:monoamine oxidase